MFVQLRQLIIHLFGQKTLDRFLVKTFYTCLPLTANIYLFLKNQSFFWGFGGGGAKRRVLILLSFKILTSNPTPDRQRCTNTSVSVTQRAPTTPRHLSSSPSDKTPFPKKEKKKKQRNIQSFRFQTFSVSSSPSFSLHHPHCLPAIAYQSYTFIIFVVLFLSLSLILFVNLL